MKISKFSRTADGKKKLIINVMATITTPQAEEYNFQYDELPPAPFLQVKEILDNFEEYREITVKGKVSGFHEIRHRKRLVVMLWPRLRRDSHRRVGEVHTSIDKWSCIHY